MSGFDDIRRAMDEAEVISDGREGEDSEPENLPPAPRSRGKKKGGGGYDVEAINREFALVLLGSKAVIYVEREGGRIAERKRFITIDAFRAWFANRLTFTAKGKPLSFAEAWLIDPARRSYRGVEFFPNPDGAPGSADYLNLWSGFEVVPKSKKNGYKTFKDHLLNNVCNGDAKLYSWVFGFFAQIVQRPREMLGVALVLRGGMGTGKSKVGEVFGSLFSRHYFLVDDPRYVTGQFNAHMASCLLLQADEAVWAGDKAAEGRLKGLVTAKIQQIEAKGVDPIQLDNFVRLMMTSNEGWVVPAGKDERRFCVLDVHPRCAQNADYFREIDAELDNGGREALLADLLAFDLASVNLRQIPRTDALLEQKVRSLAPPDAWWLDALMRGSPTRKSTVWPQEIAKADLVDAYILHADRAGQRRKSTETELAMTLRQLVPEIRDKLAYFESDDSVRRRQSVWILPTLAECREMWDVQMQQKREWPQAVSDDGEEAPG